MGGHFQQKIGSSMGLNFYLWPITPTHFGWKNPPRGSTRPWHPMNNHLGHVNTIEDLLIFSQAVYFNQQLLNIIMKNI